MQIIQFDFFAFRYFKISILTVVRKLYFRAIKYISKYIGMGEELG